MNTSTWEVYDAENSPSNPTSILRKWLISTVYTILFFKRKRLVLDMALWFLVVGFNYKAHNGTIALKMGLIKYVVVRNPHTPFMYLYFPLTAHG